MSLPRHILVVERGSPGTKTALPSLPEHPGVVTRTVSTISEAVRELRQTGYDAVFLRVEGPDELALVLRIKTAAPEVPLCALLPKPDRELETLARESGADDVLPAVSEAGPVRTTFESALQTTEELIRKSRAVVARSRELRDESREVRAWSNALRLDLYDLRTVPVQHLMPLLMEDDPDHAFFVQRSFQRLQLPFPLPVLGNGEEAVSYLGGEGKYGDRHRYPLPTLVLLDLHLPRRDGFDVLQWIRSQPGLARLVVFILTSSSMVQDLDRALALGADCLFVKPIGLDALDGITRGMAVRWGRLYEARNKPRASR